jgi:hypothetical protein
MEVNSMKKIKFGYYLITLGLSFVLGAGVFLLLFTFKLPADGLQGINTTDERPNGCVSCHVVRAGVLDKRVNAELSHHDDHPDITKIVDTVPDDCMTCHSKDSYADDLSSIAHKVHFDNPDDNHFVNMYGGSCLNCHTMNTGTGESSLKSGPKNW